MLIIYCMPGLAWGALYVASHLILKQFYEVGLLHPFADTETEAQRGQVTLQPRSAVRDVSPGRCRGCPHGLGLPQLQRATLPRVLPASWGSCCPMTV